MTLWTRMRWERIYVIKGKEKHLWDRPKKRLACISHCILCMKIEGISLNYMGVVISMMKIYEMKP
jgi:hypothetical protein